MWNSMFFSIGRWLTGKWICEWCDLDSFAPIVFSIAIACQTLKNHHQFLWSKRNFCHVTESPTAIPPQYPFRPRSTIQWNSETQKMYTRIPIDFSNKLKQIRYQNQYHTSRTPHSVSYKINAVNIVFWCNRHFFCCVVSLFVSIYPTRPRILDNNIFDYHCRQVWKCCHLLGRNTYECSRESNRFWMDRRKKKASSEFDIIELIVESLFNCLKRSLNSVNIQVF